MFEAVDFYPLGHTTYATDNDFEVPLLDVRQQASGVMGNFRIWGKQARKYAYPGDTYAFYAQDISFRALVNNPEGIVKSQCACIVEPNFTTSDDMPFAAGLYAILLKRQIACYAQSFGVKVIVDLTVAHKFAEVNLLGVPKGWKSYCCRATRAYGPEYLQDMYYLAQEHAEDMKPLYIVYGGGDEVKKMVQQQHRDKQPWVWIPEYMQQVKLHGHGKLEVWAGDNT